MQHPCPCPRGSVHGALRRPRAVEALDPVSQRIASGTAALSLGQENVVDTSTLTLETHFAEISLARTLCRAPGFHPESEWENGEAESCTTARPERLNAHGITHGGEGLLDVALSIAARSDLPEPWNRNNRDENDVHFALANILSSPRRSACIARNPSPLSKAQFTT